MATAPHSEWHRSVPLHPVAVPGGARIGLAATSSDSAPDPSDGDVLTSDVLDTDDALVVGVVWPKASGEAGEDLTVEIRTREDGSWSEWEQLDVDDDHAPDPGSAEALDERPGTDPVVVAGSDEIQVRTTGPAPDGATVELIGEGEGEAHSATLEVQPAVFTIPAPTAPEQAVPASALTTDARSVQMAGGVLPAPTVVARSAWSARAPKNAPDMGKVRGMFVHHTATSNNYTSAQVPALLRSIQRYHMDSRNWADIGYNFLVDRFGTLWEGRAGGMDRAVVGVHTAGYNSSSFAVSYLGETGAVTPTSQVRDSLSRLIAWKFSVHAVADPLAKVAYPNALRLPAISGHRDTKSTACPGQRLYDQLGTIRSMVAARLSLTAPRLMTAGAFRGPGSSDIVTVADNGMLWRLPSTRSGQFGQPERIGTGWGSYNLITSAGDMSGDGLDDLVARATDGSMWLFRGNGRGWFSGRDPIGHGWAGLTAVVGVGDMTGNGAGDLVVRRSDGTLWLYPANGRGWFDPARPIGTGWGGVDVMVGTRDFNRDGEVDLVAKNADGTLWLYPGNGRGWLDARRPIGYGWEGIRLVAASQGWTGDSAPDVLAVMDDTSVRLFPGNGRGWFDAPRTLNQPW